MRLNKQRKSAQVEDRRTEHYSVHNYKQDEFGNDVPTNLTPDDSRKSGRTPMELDRKSGIYKGVQLTYGGRGIEVDTNGQGRTPSRTPSSFDGFQTPGPDAPMSDLVRYIAGMKE